MNTEKKFITVATSIFVIGLLAGVICGIGIGGTCKNPPPIETIKSWDLKAIKDTPLYPNFPVSLWNKETEKFTSSTSIEELYGSWEEKAPYKLSDIKSPYALIVFESPFCPYCFVMHNLLREIRGRFSKEEMEIIVINPPALSEKSALKATTEIRKYLKVADEQTKSMYITKDRNNFIYFSLSPTDNETTYNLLNISETPQLLLINKDLDILYMSTGFPMFDNPEGRSFFRVWNALLFDIKAGFDIKGGDNHKN